MPSFDIEMLHRAARLAIHGHGCVEPNPMVGCVITDKDGDVVGEGFHTKFGEAHAEVHALLIAGNKARGGTAYVTLEPCNHEGKTPPCTAALLNAGIERVVIGVADPHIEAQGGAAFLTNAGIDTIIKQDDLCKEIVAPFTHRIHTGLPWVMCKWAQTIEGCIETPEGESNWISSKESQQAVHKKRGCTDAIIVGVGTVVKDNPNLTVRNTTKHRTPLRIVIDPMLRTPHDSNLLNNEAPTLLVHSQDADISLLPTCPKIELPFKNNSLNLSILFRYLVTEYDATNVMIEGGATLFQHVFEQNLVNELWVFTSPNKASMTPKINMNTLIEKLEIQQIESYKCGVDSVAKYRVTSC